MTAILLHFVRQKSTSTTLEEEQLGQGIFIDRQKWDHWAKLSTDWWNITCELYLLYTVFIFHIIKAGRESLVIGRHPSLIQTAIIQIHFAEYEVTWPKWAKEFKRVDHAYITIWSKVGLKLYRFRGMPKHCLPWPNLLCLKLKQSEIDQI